MNTKIAYMDETGNPDLDTSKGGASSHFLIAAVIVDEHQNTAFVEAAEALQKKHFQGSEIKSSNVRAKGGHSRRIKILRDVLELNFKFYALAIDKDRINKDSGLQFKKSFIKYLNGKVYGSLFQHYADINVIADETGSPEFSQSLKTYVEKNHIPDLFVESRFELVPSKNYVGVQIADFIAGSLAQMYEGKANAALKEICLEMISTHSVGVDEWPIRFSRRFNSDTTTEGMDRAIKDYAFNQAQIYLERNRNNHDDEVKWQICVLEFLLFQSHWNDALDYVPTHALKSHLRESGYEGISDHILRSSIIAKLRDSDVLIASSNKGYKIPVQFSDMYDFAVRVDSQVVPQLQRLRKARKNLLMATSNELDILKGPNFVNLVAFLDRLQD
ncbi:DUF3800 domain-containing protein [Parahaliea mediterranea]|uniref:DUF3800 domain-containing protein n=1 Tax=Parahaliea mediterranea TaxID=651086 RepID=UPI0013004F1E|nr:DUF3800 domain-containing protein [Parahaliea mediterranea]